VPARKSVNTSFLFLVDKDTFFIKNVEATFFDLISFKSNQRNFKILQEMSLTSIFDNFTIQTADNPSREVAIFPHFLEEFTFKKRQDKRRVEGDRTRSKSTVLNKSKVATSDNDMIFEFEVSRNIRQDDPYLKVMFKLKEGHK